ncbi:retrovirus-related Pol polyprotein from transposon 412 [Trichonephila clavipes]|nr:retrovirus-related Pol polyprotein from transposon 412 [Trichonephila clavipes]
MPVQLERGQRYVAEGSCIATMLEHPSNVSLSISWDLCQGLRLVISTYLLSWTTSRNGPKCTPFRISGGCSAALDIEIWGTSSTSFRSGKKFRLCGIEGVCELLGIDKTKTTPLHPQCFLAEIFVSPCDLLFGRPPDTPSSPEEYVQNLQARFEDVHHLARERINLRTEKMKTRYDTKATGHQFKEGDKVWFYNPTRRKGLSPKLQSHWDGPYTILKIINDVVIRIRKSTNSKPRVVHYDRLAPYYGHNS